MKKVILFTSRKIQKRETKYWFQKDKENMATLFNINRFGSSKSLLITERECYTICVIDE